MTRLRSGSLRPYPGRRPECVRLSEARYVATRGVMGAGISKQEAIVGVGSCHGRRDSRKRALRREKKAGRTHSAEGPNTTKEVNPHVL